MSNGMTATLDGLPNIGISYLELPNVTGSTTENLVVNQADLTRAVGLKVEQAKVEVRRREANAKPVHDQENRLAKQNIKLSPTRRPSMRPGSGLGAYQRLNQVAQQKGAPATTLAEAYASPAMTSVPQTQTRALAPNDPKLVPQDVKKADYRTMPSSTFYAGLKLIAAAAGDPFAITALIADGIKKPALQPENPAPSARNRSKIWNAAPDLDSPQPARRSLPKEALTQARGQLVAQRPSMGRRPSPLLAPSMSA